MKKTDLGVKHLVLHHCT